MMQCLASTRLMRVTERSDKSPAATIVSRLIVLLGNSESPVSGVKGPAMPKRKALTHCARSICLLLAGGVTPRRIEIWLYVATTA